MLLQNFDHFCKWFFVKTLPIVGHKYDMGSDSLINFSLIIQLVFQKKDALLPITKNYWQPATSTFEITVRCVIIGGIFPGYRRLVPDNTLHMITNPPSFGTRSDYSLILPLIPTLLLFFSILFIYFILQKKGKKKKGGGETPQARDPTTLLQGK